MTNEQLWETVLGELELSLSKANFTTWFKNTFIHESGEGKILIAVPNAFTKTWFENKYHTQILKTLQRVTDNAIHDVAYTIESPRNYQTRQPTTSAPEKVIAATSSERVTVPQSYNNINGLNPDYSFETFVVGKGNELAKAAAMAVSEKIGEVYNPLFIYGGVGLGKTHLMQAIGNQILSHQEKKQVVYTTCEKFTSEFVQAVSRGDLGDFKSRYRNVDTLLIDDIQFLAGKEGTQEEFFHTFNTLHQAKKQIVISSDRPPKAIPSLENRLISRFEWGMIVDISQPDYETRLAILENKCDEKKCQLAPEIRQYIAQSVQNNIRELEGALNRIIAYHELNQSTPTLESTKQLLSTITSQPKKRALLPKQVVEVVAGYYDVELDKITGISRKKELVVPRQIIMFLLREELSCSFPSIGHELGGRDHTTAMHAYAKIRDALASDEKLNQDISLIKQRLYNGG
ncbi:MAG: chromosomal replication initiator protein DnaA [bacterium]|nr:chromosomal replication initiator protein DnaA [bacterium]